MKLKEYLEKNGIKPDQAADDIGTHQEYIRAIASGRVRPGWPITLKIEAWSNGEVSRGDLRPDLWPE